jgi:hypothetical protein
VEFPPGRAAEQELSQILKITALEGKRSQNFKNALFPAQIGS